MLNDLWNFDPTKGDVSPIMQAAMMSLKYFTPLGPVGGALATSALSFGLNYIQGRAMQKSEQRAANQLETAAKLGEDRARAQNIASQQRADAAYRASVAVGGEQAGQARDIYRADMEYGFRQEDYGRQRAQELRAAAAERAIPRGRDILRGSLFKAAQAGVTDYVSGKIAQKAQDWSKQIRGFEKGPDDIWRKPVADALSNEEIVDAYKTPSNVLANRLKAQEQFRAQKDIFDTYTGAIDWRRDHNPFTQDIRRQYGY